MQTEKRQQVTGVIERVLAAPHRYRFAQLLNLLLRQLRQQGVPYRQAFDQVLRFRNSVSLAFPASEIEHVQAEFRPGDASGSAFARIHITPTFFGLLGAGGTLPLHDTERAGMTSTADERWQPFIDLLSNRTIGLFYEAWGKYRVEHGLIARGRDDLLPRLNALAGAAPHGSVPAQVTAFYAGLLRTRPIAASTIERVLGDYFGVGVRLEEFVGAWDPVPAGMRATLGITDPTLGYGAVLGTRLWRHDLRVRLHIGPLGEEQAKAFRPHGPSHIALQDMVSLFAVPSVQYEIRLVLDKPCIRPLTLRTRGPDRRHLGWNAFLTGTPGRASRPDIRSVMHLTPSTPAQVSRNRLSH